jgi:hypothetical protein
MINVRTRSSEAHFRVITLVPTPFDLHVRNVMATNSAPYMNNYSVKLVLFKSAGKSEFRRINYMVCELDEPVVLVVESFEVQLHRLFITRRMLGGTSILSMRSTY